MSSFKAIQSHLVEDLRTPAFFASLIISAWIFWTTEIINQDATLYLTAARFIAAGDWSVACSSEELQCWLLYPSLISFVNKITTLDLETSAYLLNAILSGLMVYVFLTIVRELGASRRTMIFAVFVILLHPYLNESRSDILRDHGYWLFYLSAMLFFIRYCRRPDWRQVIAWLSAAVVATLFRIEGVVFLALLPLALLFDTEKTISERLMLIMKLVAAPITAAVCLTVWWLVDPTIVDLTGRLLEPISRLNETWVQLDTGLDTKAAIIGDQVLGSYLDHYAMNSLWAVLGLIILTKIMTTLTPVYSLFVLIKRFWVNFSPPAIVGRLLVWIIFVNLCVMFVALVTRFHFSGRFVMPLVLVLLLFVPFVLDAVYAQWASRREMADKPHSLLRWVAFPLVVIALLYNGVDGLYKSNKGSKTYLREAGYWLGEQATTNARIFSNDDRVTYYSGLPSNWSDRANTQRTKQAFTKNTWHKYDLIALHADKGDIAFRKKITENLGEPIETFSNKKTDSVLIFKGLSE